jgi:accessory colonization factor AcfC
LATSQANAAQSSGSAVTVAKNGADSALRSEARTWVQIVAIDGTKTNLNTTPGELIKFKAKETAAIVFGQPSAAHLEIQGRTVDLSRFVVEPERRRALVIIREALQNP